MSRAAILIVEDEPLIADDLAATLERRGYAVTAIVDEAADALQSISERQPDLALLDVNIEGDIDGIELAAQLSIPFIFLTSYYDDTTLNRAKATGPAGYLVKPFNEAELIANVEMSLAKTRHKEALKEDPEKLFLRNGHEIVAVMSCDILYVEAFDNYATVYTSHDKYIISHTLKSIEEKLIPFGFKRIHRSYLINFEKIDSISENYVFIEGTKVQIGKSYRKDFLDSIALL